MATTRQLLTWIEQQCHGWNREGPRGTRALLNEAHKLLLQREADANITYDNSTGDLPFISTTAGTHFYDSTVDPVLSAFWKIAAILVDTDETLGDTNFKAEEYEVAGIAYHRILNVRTQISRQTTSCAIMFVGVDPGTTSSLYRVFGYTKPTEITSDSVQHQMPGTTDMEFLVPATVKLIEGFNHGNVDDARKYILTVLQPLVFAEMGRGEQGNSSFCVKRPY